MLIRFGCIVADRDRLGSRADPTRRDRGEMGDNHVGLQARLMSQALRKMTGALSGAGTTAIFINQLREKIGVMFGSPETTTGGRALKFYASVRLDVRRIETLKDGQEMVGNRTRVKVVKNKVAPPFKQAEFDILYGQGISREGSLIDLGVDTGIIRKAGAWFTYDADQLGQGRENARSYLRNNPDLADELEKKIKERMGIGPKIDLPRRHRSRYRRGGVLQAVPVDPEVPPHGGDADAELPENWQLARAIALRKLTTRAHTRHELDLALQAKNVATQCERCGARPDARGRFS